MPQVEVENLRKAFDGFWAVDGVSFTVREGEIFGFLGPNGAGKTTTIRMLCGILKPTQGRIQVAEIDVVRYPEKVKRIVGYMSQKFSLYEELTALENLKFYGDVYRVPRGELKERIEEAMLRFDLDAWRGIPSSDLPGGVRQRLALACSTLHKPRILFLDEPTSGVDPLARKSFWDFIKEKKREGVSTFVTTHYMEEAEACDRLALIHEGRIKAMDTPSRLKDTFLNEKGRVFEAPLDALEPYLEQLRRLPFLRDVLPHGALLHLVVEPSLSLEGLVGALESQLGLKIEGVMMREVLPTLEDVFVGLLGGSSGN